MSNKLQIAQTDSNPFLEITRDGENFVLKGNSFISEPRLFYEAILAWARDFKVPLYKLLNIAVTPGYYSTSNIQVFNLVFKTLAANNPGAVVITFYINPEEEVDMEDTIHSLSYNTGLEPVKKYNGRA